jgi:hypothetical protein
MGRKSKKLINAIGIKYDRTDREAGFFCLFLSLMIGIGPVLSGLHSRDRWLEHGVGQVRECVKIDSVEWTKPKSSRPKHRDVYGAYGLFKTKSGKQVRASLGGFSISPSGQADFAKKEFTGQDCVGLWYQPGYEHIVWFSEIKPPLSDMRVWHWLLIWTSLFFAGLSLIFLTGKSNAAD